MNQTNCTTGEPLVTVVIPCYKQAHFLGEAIESVLRQTYQGFEIIVVDDGSPDNTAEVAARYPQVRCISQQNLGLSAARNTGIRESRGDYLVFLDADDRLWPNALAANLACIAERPEAALVFGRYRVIREDGSIANHASRLYEGGDLYYGLLHLNCIGMVATVMYWRAVLADTGGFDARISPAADYDLYLRIARRYPSHSHQEIIADYRIYEASMSHDYALMLRAVIIALRSQWPYVKGNAKYEEAYQVGKRTWWEYYGEELYLQTAKRMWRLKNWRQTIRGLWYLGLYYPQVVIRHGGNRIAKLTMRLRNTFNSGD